MKPKADALVSSWHAYQRDRHGAGCSTIPTLEARTVGKMGLKGVPGLNIAPYDSSSGGGSSGRGGGRGELSTCISAEESSGTSLYSLQSHPVFFGYSLLDRLLVKSA